MDLNKRERVWRILEGQSLTGVWLYSIGIPDRVFAALWVLKVIRLHEYNDSRSIEEQWQKASFAPIPKQ